MTCFAQDGYKKTAVSEIAAAAGVSKASVFHYFGTKKELYLFLLDEALGMLLDEFSNARPSLKSADFFERLVLSVKLKTQLMKRNQAVLMFITSVYYEQADEVRVSIAEKLRGGDIIRDDFMLGGIDGSRFKPGIDPRLIMKMMAWLSAGIADEWRGKSVDELDELLDNFLAVTAMLKNNFYREEL
jgi:AcrR family transcriptional regulator